MVGAFFAVISTVSFGLHNAAMRRGVLGAAAVQALYVTVILGAPVLLVAAALSGELERAASISPNGYALLAAAGLVHFLFGRYCNYRAVSAIGSNRAGPFMGTSLLYSVAIAVLFQGETVSGSGMVGVGLMFVAPLLLIRGPARRA
ncbi:MAG: DMT family transporter, partial [Chloroflexota bacterium]